MDAGWFARLGDSACAVSNERADNPDSERLTKQRMIT